MTSANKNSCRIIFDCGGVIIDIHPNESMRQLAMACGVQEEEIRKIYSDIAGGIYPKELGGQYGKGKISTSTFIREMIYLLPQPINEEEFIKCDRTILGADKQETVALAQELRSRGFEIGIFSNTTELHWEHLRRDRLWFPLFSPVFASHEVGLSKPAEETFRFMERELGAQARDCILVDDIQKNIEAANSYGWKGIHFTSAAQTRAELERHLGGL